MTLVSERIGQFFAEEHRVEYTEFGSGDHWVVLVPGHLVSRRVHQPLARTLAAAGAHVVTIDLLGQGRSDRPEDPLQYSMRASADQVLGLLDHLGASGAVIGGTALGANVALEVAVLAPTRVRGLLLEAPVLENGVEAGLLTAGPVLFAARYVPLAVSGLRLVTRTVPRGLVPFWVGVGLDACDQRPGSLAATTHGRFFGGLAPSARQRMAIDAPALVVGRRHDPLHPEADARMLADELVAGRLVLARSPVEWRLRPERLDAVAVGFVAECWARPESGLVAQASS